MSLQSVNIIRCGLSALTLGLVIHTSEPCIADENRTGSGKNNTVVDNSINAEGDVERTQLILTLNRQAELLYTQGKYAEAEPLYRKILEKEQKKLKDQPNLTTARNNLAASLQAQGKYDEAENLYREALKMMEQKLGNNNLDVAISLNNLAELLQFQGKYTEAEQLYRQALAIGEQNLGKDNPHTIRYRNNLKGLREKMH
ncbi:MAG: tetratricopeptide repeat protein [Chlorobiaceae bacterium]